MLLLTDRKGKLFFYLILFILLSTQITKNQNIIKHSTTTVNYIEVIGMYYENNLKVSESLNSLLFQNIFFINKSDFNNILKDNNLIESFYIKKFYPNEIKINIKQADLLAITNQNGKKFYIGSNGKLISIDKRFNRLKSCLAFIKFKTLKDFKLPVFKDQLEKWKKKITPCNNVEDWIDAFLLFYNFNLRAPKKKLTNRYIN